MTRAQGTKGSISIKEWAEAAAYKPNVLQCIYDALVYGSF
jgi:hypothetical protein